MVFEENHLLRGEGGYAKTNEYWPYEPTYFHLEHNYWGTTDLDEIAEYILDGYDMPNVNMYVVYEPIEPAPVQVERKSWGEVKSLYRDVGK